MLTRGQKETIVKELKDSFHSSPVLTLLDYKGLSVQKISDFRDQIRGLGGILRVGKNTLMRIALKEAGFEEETFLNHISGTNAILFVKENADPMPVLRAMVKFAKDQPFLVPKAAVFEGQVFEGEAIVELSRLPSREELYAMLCNRLQAPIYKSVFALNGILAKLLYALEAIKAEKSKTE